MYKKMKKKIERKIVPKERTPQAQSLQISTLNFTFLLSGTGIEIITYHCKFEIKLNNRNKVYLQKKMKKKIKKIYEMKKIVSQGFK